MTFQIRKATREDLPQIMEVMEEAASNSIHPDWFVDDDLEFVENHLDHHGFVVVAEASGGEIAGFFLVKEPAEEENLGKYLDFPHQKLAKVAVMDSAAVRSTYRGNGLQGKMLEEAEKLLDQRFIYLMCTIHPDNIYSLHNMQNHGYEIQRTVKCYGGLDRHILMKERGC